MKGGGARNAYREVREEGNRLGAGNSFHALDKV